MKTINYFNEEITLDEEPYQIDSKWFDCNYYWYAADGHSENKKFTIYWVGNEDGEYDVNDPYLVEEHLHYELEGSFFGVDDHWEEDADGLLELCWVLDKIDDNGAAIIDKIIIYNDFIPEYFNETFEWKYSWEAEEKEGKIILNIIF